MEHPIYQKDYAAWHALKSTLDSDTRLPTFAKREIWWCSTGVNVGVEQDGKNRFFERPVLIVRKFNKRLFWGVPLTSKRKDWPYRYTIHYKAKNETAAKERQLLLLQLRAYDAARLLRPIVKLSSHQFIGISEALAALLLEPASVKNSAAPKGGVVPSGKVITDV